MNQSIVLVKPHACRTRFLDAMRDHFDTFGVRVDDVLLLNGPEVRRGAYVERHYGSAALVATGPTSDLASFASERSTEIFFAAFGESWETVVAEHRVLTPGDAMIVLGDITALELHQRWCAAKSHVRLEFGFYVTYFTENDVYVVNGFYPHVLKDFTAPDAQTCLFIVSWPEQKFTWNSFRLDILGAADPNEAQPLSLRHLMCENWEAYGFAERPSLMCNGFDSASGPIEALSQRLVWLHRRPNEDEFGRLMLQEGLSMDFVSKLVQNPTLSLGGETRPVFELMENIHSSEALQKAAILYAVQDEANRHHPSSLGESGIALQATADWTIVLNDEDAEEKRNRALVFIKPHANTANTRALVEERLMQVSGMQIVVQRVVVGSDIARQKVMDQHYGTISRYATRIAPKTIEVCAKSQSLFKEAFGVTWSEALSSGRVWNAKTALRILGEISSNELYDLWNACTKTIRLTSGAYVGHFAEKGVFIINGFYPYIYDSYSAPEASVMCYVVAWPEATLTWRAFREDIIGSTNPNAAAADSLRGLIRDRWHDLGLTQSPTTTNNGVHASAGPLEAVLERQIWLGISPLHDPLALRLTERGLSGALLYRWAPNPEVLLSNGERKAGRVFDLLENMQTSDFVEVMREAEQQTLALYNEVPMNRAVVVLRPFAATDQAANAVRLALAAVGARVVRDGTLRSCRVVEQFLHGTSFKELESNAAAGPDVPMEVKKAFTRAFSITWDDCVAGDRLLGADAAMEVLSLTPVQLLDAWDSSMKVKRLEHHFHVAYLSAHDVFVVNGFVPFLRTTHARPGSHVHVFEVEWRETEWTWRDFCDVVIGDPDPSVASKGSLQRLFADEWKNHKLQLQPVSRATGAIHVSQGPLEGIADREMWLSVPIAEDPFTQHLLLEGAPLSMLIPYIRDTPLTRDEEYSRSILSRHQQSSEVVRRLKALTMRLLRGLKMSYAFLWVKPHAATEEVLEWIPRALDDHRVAVIDSGSIPMEEVIERQLVDQQYNALYRNAMTRDVDRLPLKTHEMVEFEHNFGISWATAIRLHLVINAAQAVERIGVLQLLADWDASPKKVCLSPSLYIAYLEREGLYVINGFYPYLRSRIYTGPRIYWFTVAWDGEIMTWEDFQQFVIGSEVPTMAAVGSLRNGLSAVWQDLALAHQPDGLDNGFYASSSPVEGLADRVVWLGKKVEEDIFGRLLLQGGVDVTFLNTILKNPLVRHRNDPVDSLSEAFDKLCRECPLLVAQLVGLHTSGGMQVVSKRSSHTVRENGVGDVVRSKDVEITRVTPPQLPTDPESSSSSSSSSPPPPDTSSEDKGSDSEKTRSKDVYEETPKCAEEKQGGESEQEPQLQDEKDEVQDEEAEEKDEDLWEPLLSDNSAVEMLRIAKVVRAAEKKAEKVVESFKRNYAFLLVSPNYAVASDEDRLVEYMNDFLTSHKIQVELHGAVRAIAPPLRNMYSELRSELFKYALHLAPVEYELDTNAYLAFKKAFGESWNPGRVRNAVDAAVEFGLSAQALQEAWNKCNPRVCIAPSLFVGRMMNYGGLYLVNGFALHSADVFNASASLKVYFLLSWGIQMGDYDDYASKVVGDPADPEAGSIHDALRSDWRAAGLSSAPDALDGAIVTSSSALEAMRQRQLWLSLGISHDPLARFAREHLDVSPYTIRWATSNPHTETPGHFLLDTARGMGGPATLRLLAASDARHRATAPRNAAFVLVKSHALCRPFAQTIKTILSRARVRIDEEGDLSGAAVRERGLVHHLYSTASRYATQDVSTIRLKVEERELVRRRLKVPWNQLIRDGVLLNAYQALEVLGGGVTSTELHRRWMASTRRVTIRPDLTIAELEDGALFVINGFFPEMKQSLESSHALLHWYTVSWHEGEMGWQTFLETVIGEEDPTTATPMSVRGQLYRRWCEYGLTTPPDALRNGVHVSEGPLQAMRERTHCLRYPIEEDYLGDMLLRHGVRMATLQAWLNNPVVSSGESEAGVFEHLRHCSTGRLIRLLAHISKDANYKGEEEKYDTAGGSSSVSNTNPSKGKHNGDAGNGKVKRTPCIPAEWFAPEEGEEVSNEHKLNSGGKINSPEASDSVLYCNTALLLVKPHAVSCPRVLTLLERTLAAHDVRIRLETRKLCTPRHVDRHFASAMRYATHNYLRAYPEVTEEGREKFCEAFGETWEHAMASRRVIGSFDALNRFTMTPAQLFVKWSLPQQQHVKMASGMDLVRLHAENVFVMNAQFPYERERFIEANGLRDVHCYVVSFDQRKCTWRRFLDEIIGHEDPARAVDGSFRAALHASWEALGLAAPPNQVDNGISASGGPLQAYAERGVWCASSDLVPDPFLRAACQEDCDPSEVLEWRGDTLVRYTGTELGADGATGQLFGLTHALDTREAVALLDERGGCFVPISDDPKEDGTGPSGPGPNAAPPARKGRLWRGMAPAAAAAALDETDAWVQPALQRGGEEDVAQLWAYYGGGAACVGYDNASSCSEREETAAALLTEEMRHLTATIDGESFRRDVEALECFGQPLDKGVVKKLFEGMACRGDGRFTYEEFCRVLAVLRRM